MSVDERTNTEFIETVGFTDFEELLGEKYGERFREYREKYRKSLNYDTNGYIPDFPLTVTLELVNRCNLNCIMCYTVNHSEKKSTLGMENMKTILAEGQKHGLPALVLGLGSEPLLFKGAKDVMKAAIDADVMDLFLGSNGVLLTEDIAEFLVVNQVARLEVSLDAATPETYEKIRGKNELEKIEANLHRLIELKKVRNSALPVVRLTFCVQELNHQERGAFLEKWRDRVDYVDFQMMVDHGDIDELRETGTVSEVEELDLSSSYCAYPFNSLHVWANGNITPCCTFFAKSEELILGNVAEMTLEEAWNGGKIDTLRQELLSGNVRDICRVCLSQRAKEMFDDVVEENRSERRAGD
jgi:radical SAM protein with 4Fe4S-binding SPASM domain